MWEEMYVSERMLTLAVADTIQKGIAVEPNSLSSAAGMCDIGSTSDTPADPRCRPRRGERSVDIVSEGRYPKPGSRNREAAEPDQVFERSE